MSNYYLTAKNKQTNKNTQADITLLASNLYLQEKRAQISFYSPFITFKE